MNEVERNTQLLLHLNSLKEIKAYNQIAALSKALIDDTVLMKKSFTIITEEIEDSDARTIDSKLNNNIQKYLKEWKST